ncbi:hypothetical protein PCANB_001697 [Pneumocystis canis]|nr:hypothetical protein PCANB_001697 [Pneumocystis canis]
MGVPGLWSFFEESKERISLAKLASNHYMYDCRIPKGFRVGIDTSIWLYQIRAGQGGQNPELRTLYFRLCRLRYLGILPIFVLDGPNRPAFKRKKRIQKTAFLLANIIRLIKLFGFPIWYAPGEAEAECALLKKKCIIDAVMSDDVDSLIFGSQIVIRDWGGDDDFKTNTPTHVSIYNMETIMKNIHISEAGMLLIPLMSCGDYDSIGIPNCGIKTAIDAAKAGFGDSLLTLVKSGSDLTEWKNNLEKSLRTNANKYFSTKHPSLKLPKDFPNQDIIKFYTNPVITTDFELKKKASCIVWKWPINITGLQEFVSVHFNWSGLPGIKKFIQSFAPCYLVSLLNHVDSIQHVKMIDFQKQDSVKKVNPDYFTNIKEYLKNMKSKKINDFGIKIYSSRKHISTDYSSEFRVSFYPFKLIDVDKFYQILLDQKSGSEILEENENEVSNSVKSEEKENIDLDKRMTIWILEPYLQGFIKNNDIEWNKLNKKTDTMKALGSDQIGAIENYFKVPSKCCITSESLNSNLKSLDSNSNCLEIKEQTEQYYQKSKQLVMTQIMKNTFKPKNNLLSKSSRKSSRQTSCSLIQSTLTLDYKNIKSIST